MRNLKKSAANFLGLALMIAGLAGLILGVEYLYKGVGGKKTMLCRHIESCEACSREGVSVLDCPEAFKVYNDQFNDYYGRQNPNPYTKPWIILKPPS